MSKRTGDRDRCKSVIMPRSYFAVIDQNKITNAVRRYLHSKELEASELKVCHIARNYLEEFERNPGIGLGEYLQIEV